MLVKIDFMAVLLIQQKSSIGCFSALEGESSHRLGLNCVLHAEQINVNIAVNPHNLYITKILCHYHIHFRSAVESVDFHANYLLVLLVVYYFGAKIKIIRNILNKTCKF